MLLLRGATTAPPRADHPFSGFNTCSSCEEQQAVRAELRGFIAVSIHAPLVRSNRRVSKSPPPFELFQYMLLLRGATRKSAHLCGPRRFQYMLLLRGATCNQAGQPGRNKFQYMLLLRGATGCAYPPSSKWSVSIHTPLARSNGSSWHQGGRVKCFNTCSSCEEQLRTYP